MIAALWQDIFFFDPKSLAFGSTVESLKRKLQMADNKTVWKVINFEEFGRALVILWRKGSKNYHLFSNERVD